jgi:tetratricopeptide (TPR) repeat protein
VEAERRTPSSNALAYFADRLGVSVDELTTGRPAESPVNLLIALAEAELAGDASNYSRIRVRAAEYGLTRIEAAALAGMGKPADADALLAAEPITIRAPLLAAWAQKMNPTEAVYALENALSHMEAEGLPDPDAEAELRYGLVRAYTELGLIERAAEEADTAEALVGSAAEPDELTERYLRTARTLRDQGRLLDAEAAAERARAACRRRGHRQAAAMGQWAHGRLLLQAGDHSGAIEALTEARRLLGPVVAGELAEALRRVGKTAEALEVVVEAEPSVAYRIKGLIARDAGELDTAERELRAALEASAGLDGGIVARELGDLLRAAGRELEAIEVYRQGLIMAEKGGEAGGVKL